MPSLRFGWILGRLKYPRENSDTLSRPALRPFHWELRLVSIWSRIADRNKVCDRLRLYGNILLPSSAILRSRSQTIAGDRTMLYLLRSSAFVIAGSQTIAEVCFHMIADDRRPHCDLRSASTIAFFLRAQVILKMETGLRSEVKLALYPRWYSHFM